MPKSDLERALEARWQSLPADQRGARDPVDDPTRIAEIEALFGGSARPPRTPGVPRSGAGPVVTVQGLALDAVAGAIVQQADGTVCHVFGLRRWPPELYGRQVQVRGRSGTARLAPDLAEPAAGLPRRGMWGEAGGLYGAEWELLPEEPSG